MSSNPGRSGSRRWFGCSACASRRSSPSTSSAAGIEELPPDVYDGVSYYEKWIAGLAAILVEKGVLGRDELDARIEDVAARKAAGAPVVEKSAGSVGGAA